jgi:hypothetical protein
MFDQGFNSLLCLEMLKRGKRPTKFIPERRDDQTPFSGMTGVFHQEVGPPSKMTTASLLQNSYGLPEGLPTAITKLSLPTVVLEDVCQEIVDFTLCSSLKEDDVSKLDKVIPFLYDQGELSGKISVALSYAIKRLFRGLATISMHTKLNYAAVLRALIKEHSKVLPVSTLYSWLQAALCKSNVSGDSKMNATEENAMLSGRLIGFDVLLMSTPIVKVASAIVKDSLFIWGEKEHLCFLAQSIIVKTLNSLDELERITCAKTMEAHISTLDLSSRVIALVVAIRYQCGLPSFGIDISEMSKDILQPIHFMPLLSSLDFNHLDRPSVFALYSSVLKALLNKRRLNEFAQCWNDISLILLQRIKLGGSVLKRLLSEFTNADDEFKQILLTNSVVEYLAKGDDGAVSEFTWSEFVTSEVLAAKVVKILLEVNQQHKASASILSALGAEKCQKVFEMLYTCEFSEQSALRFADLHLTLLAPGSLFLAEKHNEKVGMESLMRFALLHASEKIYSRVQSALVRLGDVDSSSLEDWSALCLQLVDERFDTTKKTGKKLLRELDEPVQDSWKTALELPRRIEKLLVKSSKKDIHNSMKALRMMAITGRLMLLLDPLASANIFDDLTQCYDRLAKGKGKDSDDLHPIDVLVDILLQWLSRPSALLRRVANTAFTLLVPTLTETSLQSIFKVLTTIPGGEREDLMDQEEIDDTDTDDAALEACNMGSLAKRFKVDEEPSLDISDADSEIMNLDDADADELALLDTRLSTIMSERKQQQGANITSRLALVHFKQRVLDWLKIIGSSLSDSAAFMAKIRMIPPILDLFRIHTVPKNRVSDAKFKSDKELLAKTFSIFNEFYSVSPKVSLTKEEENTCRDTVSKLLKDLKGFDAPLLSHTFTAFWFAFEAVTTDQESTLETLRPHWIAVIKEGDKKHSSAFLSFFQQLISKSPSTMIHLVSESVCLELLSNARFFTREKIIHFIDPALKVPLKEGTGRIFFQSLMTMYLKGIEKEDGFFRKAIPGQLRQELSLLNTIVAKSRHFLTNKDLPSWESLLEVILKNLEHSKDRFQANQFESAKNRIKSMQGLLNSKK